MKNIRHILFDLGGVLLNLNVQNTIQAFQRSGISGFEKWIGREQQPEWLNEFEKGTLSREEFVAIIQQHTGQPISTIEIINNWNAMLLDFPLRRLQILQQLQIHYDLFLLSNTNEIHEACFQEKIKTQTGYSSLNVFFDRVYFSHRVGIRKPELPIFEKVLSENQLKPEKTLFIDDSKANTEAAASLGIQTIWLQEGMSIETDIFKPKTC